MTLPLLQHPALWRGDSLLRSTLPVRASGHAGLDAVLPGGGWPLGATSELCLASPGAGEFALLAPALAAISQAGLNIVLVAPPLPPYAPAWQAAGVVLARLLWVRPADAPAALWASEQALRESACGAVLLWHAGSLADRAARRLNLAAAGGGGCGFVLRGRAERAASPFGLRLALEAVPGGLQVRVLKRRGPLLTSPLFLPRSRAVSADAVARAFPPASADRIRSGLRLAAVV